MSIQATTEGNENALLHVSGVDTPIHASVTRKSERGMTVEQALPFLQLHTPVWDAVHKASRIESVSVVICDGTPRLVLDLAFDDADATNVAADGEVKSGVSAAFASAERTEHTERTSSVPPPLPRRAHAGVVRARGRVDHTQSFDTRDAVSQEDHGALTAEREAATPTAPDLRGPSREPTQLFLTELSPEARLQETEAVQRAKAMGLSLNAMEQELLTPKDFVYHAKLAWLRAEPHVERARARALVWSKLAYDKARPIVVQAARASLRALSSSLRTLLAKAEAVRQARAERAVSASVAESPAPALTSGAEASPSEAGASS